jgi:hypothetical protein
VIERCAKTSATPTEISSVVSRTMGSSHWTCRVKA